MERIGRLLFCLLWGGMVFGDVVTLKDGTRINGMLESGTELEVRIKVGQFPQMVPVDQIQSIQFVSPEILMSGSTYAATAPSVPQSTTLPVGTEIAVRTISRIESKTSKASQEYEASLDDPIKVGGVEVVPANAKAFLRVGDVRGGTLMHPAAMGISLAALIVGGQRVTVNTDELDSKAGSRAKRTATGALAGAATGAAIGAIAGGGLGAGIGAATGGAIGGVAGRVTAKGVEIPSETRFTYRLTQPVVINAGGGQ